MKTIKEFFVILLVFVLCSSCTNHTESEISKNEPSTEVSSALSASSEEEKIDPFTVADDIIDSENDIVIDIHTFIEDCNDTHKESINHVFDDSSIKAWGPDFYENLGLVSKDEADALLTTPENDDRFDITKEQALSDIDLLFRVFKSFYGPYYYFGGDETFSLAEEKIIKELSSFPENFSVYDFSDLISENLYFIKDRHMNIGRFFLCDYNAVSTDDFYVKDLYFYEDDIGIYTKIHGRKWYLDSIGTDKNTENYLRTTVDEKGQLCYMLCISVPKNDKRLSIDRIILTRGEKSEAFDIKWISFSRREENDISEIITEKNNIPLLTVRFADYDEESQGERIQKLGKDMLAQDVFIYDAFSGCGFQALFDEYITYKPSDLDMYKLSDTADFLGRWNMPWDSANVGEYFSRITYPKWGENDTLIFAVQDKGNFSAAEDSIADMRSIENIIFIGGSTGGTAGPSGGTNQHMVLPETGLFIHFGASLMISSGYNEKTFAFDPDIWYEPTESAEAAYRICEFYGIENTGALSALVNS